MKTLKTTWNKKTGELISELPLEMVEVIDFNGKRKDFGFVSPRLMSVIRRLQEVYNEDKADKDCRFFEVRANGAIKGRFTGRWGK